MEVIINESQMLRLFEVNTTLDNLNNLIDPKKIIYEFGYKDSFIEPSSVMLEGNIEDEDIGVRVTIGKVVYNGQDVTEFANNYVFFSGDGDDSNFTLEYKVFISDKINQLLRVTPIKISEWDVYIGIEY
jgi:hypothetical protein|tara:strand:+ start:806 stop:1192 length:387 start_codon:yes stop_codon:yes gene_type:complete